MVFLLSASFIAYAPDYVKKINDFSSDISTASLDLGTKILLPDSDSKGKDSVDLIRDSLFAIQVRQPWLLLQFGDSDVEEIGSDRVEALVSASPSDEDGKTREEVVKAEIEDRDNDNLTIPQVINRLGMVFFLLIFNLGITIFVFLLTAMMIFSQILFIIFAMFLPVSFLLSMIPGYESMAKQAIVRVFNTIMTRAGITLIVTVAFSISSMFYNISSDYPFFMIAFLQIVTFAGIYMKLGDLMSMFSLNAGDTQHMGRRIFRRPYLFMRHRARRMERRITRAVGASTLLGAGAGAAAGSALAGHTGAGGGRKAQPQNKTRENKASSRSATFGSRAGSAVGAVLDTKNKAVDKAKAVKENIKDMPTQTAYAVHSAKENVKTNVSDFKRGMVQEQQNRQTGRTERQEQHRQSIADKRIALQKAQEARRTSTQGGGSATAGASRPATASPTKQSQRTPEKKERPVTADKAKADKIPTEPTKTQAVRERPPVSDTSCTGQTAAARERPLSSREDTKPSGQKASVQGERVKRSEVQATQRERVHATSQTATVQQEQRTQTTTAIQQTRQSKKQSRQRKKGQKQ